MAITNDKVDYNLLIISIKNKFIPFYKFISKNSYRIPFSIGKKPKEFKNCLCKTIIPLRDYQKKIQKNIIDKLREKNSVILAMGTGLGKTAISCSIINMVKGRTIIFSDNKIIQEQWKKELLKFIGKESEILISKKPEKNIIILIRII